RTIIEAAIDSTDLACSRQPLQRFIDGAPAGEIGEVAGRPHLARLFGDAGEQAAAEVGTRLVSIGHVRNMPHVSDDEKRPKDATFFGRDLLRNATGRSQNLT